MVESSGDLPGVTAACFALLPRKAMQRDYRSWRATPIPPQSRFPATRITLFFQFGDRLLLSRKLTGNFPDFERVLPKDQPNSVTLEREEFRGD
jgi:DNA polymerase-3 subunit beta